MGATPETFSKSAARKALAVITEQAPRALWRWWLQPAYGQCDGPDLIGLLNGRFFAIEFKADKLEGGKKVRGGQAQMLAHMSDAAQPPNLQVPCALAPGHYLAGCTSAAEFLALTEWLIAAADTLIDDGARARIRAVPWRTAQRLAQRAMPPRAKGAKNAFPGA